MSGEAGIELSNGVEVDEVDANIQAVTLLSASVKEARDKVQYYQSEEDRMRGLKESHTQSLDRRTLDLQAAMDKLGSSLGLGG